MNLWLGLDDTDHLEGGCTTFEFHKLLEALPCPYGEPRLVRLWPFAAHRTRGNAALSVEIHPEEGIVEWLDGYWDTHIAPLAGTVSSSNHNEREQHPADPGMVLFDNQPAEEYYWNAVRGETSFIEGGIQWGGHGRIGAAAACAWRENTVTWEGIAWRDGERVVSGQALTKVDSMEGTFLCRDPRTKRGLIAPRGACPVMFGVRARDLSTAKEATRVLIEAEGTGKISAHRIFVTNQASGDHLQPKMETIVHSLREMKGGHIEINNSILAFKRGGEVNTLAQWLKVGDRIQFNGLLFEGMWHLELLRVLESTTEERPLCCGKRMKSMGSGQGIRCPTCKSIMEDTWIQVNRVPPIAGWAEPPSDSRRHLARPADWEA